MRNQQQFGLHGDDFVSVYWNDLEVMTMSKVKHNTKVREFLQLNK